MSNYTVQTLGRKLLKVAHASSFNDYAHTKGMQMLALFDYFDYPPKKSNGALRFVVVLIHAIIVQLLFCGKRRTTPRLVTRSCSGLCRIFENPFG